MVPTTSLDWTMRRCPSRIPHLLVHHHPGAVVWKSHHVEDLHAGSRPTAVQMGAVVSGGGRRGGGGVGWAGSERRGAGARLGSSPPTSPASAPAGIPRLGQRPPRPPCRIFSPLDQGHHTEAQTKTKGPITRAPASRRGLDRPIKVSPARPHRGASGAESPPSDGFVVYALCAWMDMRRRSLLLDPS